MTGAADGQQDDERLGVVALAKCECHEGRPRAQIMACRYGGFHRRHDGALWHHPGDERLVPASELDAALARAVRAEQELAGLREQIAAMLSTHTMYLPPAVDFDCCGGCNKITSNYVPWPCPLTDALGPLLRISERATS